VTADPKTMMPRDKDDATKPGTPLTKDELQLFMAN
jgi:hypothetical protein